MNYGTYDGLHTLVNPFVSVVFPEWRPEHPSIYDDEFDGPTLNPKWTVEAYYPLTTLSNSSRVGFYNSSLVNLDVETNGLRLSSSFCIYQPCPQNVPFYIEAQMSILPRSNADFDFNSNGLGPWIYLKDSVKSEISIFIHSPIPQLTTGAITAFETYAGSRTGSVVINNESVSAGGSSALIDASNHCRHIVGVSSTNNSSFAFNVRIPQIKQAPFISTFRDYSVDTTPVTKPAYFGLGLPPLTKIDWVRVYLNPPDRNLLTL
jgi:hypothetical protein